MVTMFRRSLLSQSSWSKKSKLYISWGNSDSKSVGLVARSPHLTSHGVTTTSKTNLNFLWLIYLLHPWTLLILFHTEHPSLSAPLNFPMHSMHGPLTAQHHHHHSPWLATPVTLPHISFWCIWLFLDCLNPEVEGIKLLNNIGDCLSLEMTLYLRRLDSSLTLMWKPKISNAVTLTVLHQNNNMRSVYQLT